MSMSMLLNWGIAELLQKYPGLRLHPAAKDAVCIAGSLAFSAQTKGQKLVSEQYEISISVPPNFPRTTPLVRETASRIPRYFHKLDSGHLCLGSPTRLRMILAEKPSLIAFIERCVIPYLYGYSIVESGGTLPFGELSHGLKGLREDLAEMIGIDDSDALVSFVRLLALKKRIANKRPCPCNSGLRLGRCHHRKLNLIRNMLGRRWFSPIAKTQRPD